jgi:uncharacterized protein involved in exopolysaccharide biosynthesis
MSQPAQRIVSPRDVAKALAAYRLRWIAPAVIITLASLGYVSLRQPVWEASQSLLVRDEAAGSVSRPGRFDSADDMKTAQETILELATSRGVLRAALSKVGPPANCEEPRRWPTKRDVEEAQRAIRLVAPNGAEFGSTEVFHLKVRSKDPKRAVALAQAVCRQVDARMGRLRDRRAQSLIEELNAAVDLARADLDRATVQLSAVEREVGGDLAELRILSESANGESNLRQTLIQLRNEQRQAEATARTTEQLLAMLKAAQQDPSQLVATPNELLEAQPALRQLKDGLIAAQLRTATLLGEMSQAHPKVKAALESQGYIRRRLHAELDAAVRGLEAQLRLSADRVGSVEQQLADVAGRMERLAALRARYGNLVAEARQRSETLKQAEHDLAAARASQAAALSASLITRLDEPAAGNDPLGPSNARILLIGLAGGLLAGLGVVFLTVPLTSPDAEAAASVDAPPHHRQYAALRDSDAAYHGLSLRQALQRLAESTPSRN